MQILCFYLWEGSEVYLLSCRIGEAFLALQTALRNLVYGIVYTGRRHWKITTLEKTKQKQSGVRQRSLRVINSQGVSQTKVYITTVITSKYLHPLEVLARYMTSDQPYLLDRPKQKITLLLFAGLVGKVRKNYLPKEEGREGGEKNAQRARAGGPGFEPGTCRVLGKGLQLHTRGADRQARLSMPIHVDRVGRLCNTMCSMFWR